MKPSWRRENSRCCKRACVRVRILMIFRSWVLLFSWMHKQFQSPFSQMRSRSRVCECGRVSDSWSQNHLDWGNLDFSGGREQGRARNPGIVSSSLISRLNAICRGSRRTTSLGSSLQSRLFSELRVNPVGKYPYAIVLLRYRTE